MGTKIMDVTVKTELPPAEAMALAQLVKRLSWSEMRACAVDDDETYLIKAAVHKLQKSLAEAGFNPR